MQKKLATVIMAAGKGKRMLNPEKSKVMFEVAGRPMIEYVIDLALQINSEVIVPIVGHQKQSVMDFITEKFNDDRVKFAYQDEQLGTGHAVMQTEPILRDFDGDVLILSGDVPLLSFETVSTFLREHNENGFTASLISAIFDEPFGYGRILRDEEGNFNGIVEEKDATEIQKSVKEINSGIYIVDAKHLFEALKTIGTDNAQKEYYLTDIFRYFWKHGLKTGAIAVKNNVEITGVNTVDQLKELSELVNKS